MTFLHDSDGGDDRLDSEEETIHLWRPVEMSSDRAPLQGALFQPFKDGASPTTVILITSPPFVVVGSPDCVPTVSFLAIFLPLLSPKLVSHSPCLRISIIHTPSNQLQRAASASPANGGDAKLIVPGIP